MFKLATARCRAAAARRPYDASAHRGTPAPSATATLSLSGCSRPPAGFRGATAADVRGGTTLVGARVLHLWPAHGWVQRQAAGPLRLQVLHRASARPPGPANCFLPARESAGRQVPTTTPASFPATAEWGLYQ